MTTSDKYRRIFEYQQTSSIRIDNNVFVAAAENKSSKVLNSDSESMGSQSGNSEK